MKVLQINAVCGNCSTGKIAVDLYNVLEKEGNDCVIAYGRRGAPEGVKTIKICGKINNLFHIGISMIFDNTIDFTYIRSKTNKLLGRITKKDYFVASERLEYKSVKKVDNSFKFITDKSYVINNLKSGVVTFIGNIDSLGESVIIKGDDGFDYYYSNIENINVKMYDYIDKGIIIGSTIDNYFLLTIVKDNKYYNYEDFI